MVGRPQAALEAGAGDLQQVAAAGDGVDPVELGADPCGSHGSGRRGRRRPGGRRARRGGRRRTRRRTAPAPPSARSGVDELAHTVDNTHRHPSSRRNIQKRGPQPTPSPPANCRSGGPEPNGRGPGRMAARARYRDRRPQPARVGPVAPQAGERGRRRRRRVSSGSERATRHADRRAGWRCGSGPRRRPPSPAPPSRRRPAPSSGTGTQTLSPDRPMAGALPRRSSRA